MDKEKKVRCPKCGFLNIDGSKKCGKCGAVIEKNYKSCPRCAKKNKVDAIKCVNCGYKFKSNKKMIMYNLVISMIVVALLFILLGAEFTGLVKGIDLVFKIIAAVLILIIFYTTINYGSKEIIRYGTDVDIKEEKERMVKMRKISTITVIVGCVVIGVILILFYCLKK